MTESAAPPLKERARELDVDAIRARCEAAKRRAWGVYNVYPYLDDLTSVLDALASTRARVVELERDAARLDWLDDHAFTAYRGVEPEFEAPECHCVVVDEMLAVKQKRSRTGNVAPTIREAIDAAITAAQPPTEEPGNAEAIRAETLRMLDTREVGAR